MSGPSDTGPVHQQAATGHRRTVSTKQRCSGKPELWQHIIMMNSVQPRTAQPPHSENMVRSSWLPQLCNYGRHQSSDWSRFLTFWRLVGFSWVLSMIFIATWQRTQQKWVNVPFGSYLVSVCEFLTSRPVNVCRASFTLAKFPFPMVFSSR